MTAALPALAFAGNLLLPVAPMLTLRPACGVIPGAALRPSGRLGMEHGMDLGAKQLMRASIVLHGFLLSVADVLALGGSASGRWHRFAGSFGGSHLLGRVLVYRVIMRCYLPTGCPFQKRLCAASNFRCCVRTPKCR